MKSCRNQSFLPFSKAQLSKKVRPWRLLSLAQFARSQVKINRMIWSGLTFLPSLQHSAASLFDLPAQDAVCLERVCVCVCARASVCVCAHKHLCDNTLPVCFIIGAFFCQISLCIFSVLNCNSDCGGVSLFLKIFIPVSKGHGLSALITGVCLLFRAQASVRSTWTARCRPASQSLWCPCAERCPWRQHPTVI